MSKKPNEPAESPKEEHSSLIEPMVDELKGKYTPEQTRDDEIAPPRGPLHPPQPAELDQDPGGGYNPDGTYPQI